MKKDKVFISRPGRPYEPGRRVTLEEAEKMWLERKLKRLEILINNNEGKKQV